MSKSEEIARRRDLGRMKSLNQTPILRAMWEPIKGDRIKNAYLPIKNINIFEVFPNIFQQNLTLKRLELPDINYKISYIVETRGALQWSLKSGVKL